MATYIFQDVPISFHAVQRFSRVSARAFQNCINDRDGETTDSTSISNVRSGAILFSRLWHRSEDAPLLTRLSSRRSPFR
jgi:hypothetical protein